MLEKIHGEIHLLGKDLDEAQRERLIQIAQRCPVHRTLSSEIKIRTKEIRSGNTDPGWLLTKGYRTLPVLPAALQWRGRRKPNASAVSPVDAATHSYRTPILTQPVKKTDKYRQQALPSMRCCQKID